MKAFNEIWGQVKKSYPYINETQEQEIKQIISNAYSEFIDLRGGFEYLIATNEILSNQILNVSSFLPPGLIVLEFKGYGAHIFELNGSPVYYPLKVIKVADLSAALTGFNLELDNVGVLLVKDETGEFSLKLLEPLQVLGGRARISFEVWVKATLGALSNDYDMTIFDGFEDEIFTKYVLIKVGDFLKSGVQDAEILNQIRGVQLSALSFLYNVDFLSNFVREKINTLT